MSTLLRLVATLSAIPSSSRPPPKILELYKRGRTFGLRYCFRSSVMMMKRLFSRLYIHCDPGQLLDRLEFNDNILVSYIDSI